MVRSTDQEQLPLKGSSLLMVLKRKDMLPYAGPHEEAPGSVKRQKGAGESTGRRFYCDFHRNGWRGRISQLSRFMIG